MTMAQGGMEMMGICGAALAASFLTFFSGFGLGTILTPVFVFFFPIEIAIVLTAIVHLANNLFKLVLMAKHAQARILVYFGIPAVLFAVLGALALSSLSRFRIPITIYSAFGKIHAITLLSFVIGITMMLFAVLEIIPAMKRVKASPLSLPLGGALSGFFGGLSGHQGALRAAFLSRLRMTPEAFIGTSVVISAFVDITRMGLYARSMSRIQLEGASTVLILACASALVGSLLGKRLLKVTPHALVQKIVATLLFLFGAALASGWIAAI